MTSTLTIEPLYRKKKSLSSDLKFALRKSNNGNTINSMRVDESDISYFTGLKHAGLDDASIVIEMINQYGECIIDEEF